VSIRHYILIGLRNFTRNKNTSLINIIGLASGMACMLLSFLWINDELKIERFHEKADRLYEVMKNIHFDDQIETDNYTPYPLASSLKDEMPEVTLAVSFYDFSGEDYPNGVLSNDSNQLLLRPAVISEDFFKVFSYEVITGNRGEPALGKRDILLSEKTALQFFKTTEEAVGAIFKWKHSVFLGTFQVAGVFKDAPENSTMQFDVIFSFDVLQDVKEDLNEWYSSTGQTFLVLADDTDIDQFNEKIMNHLSTRHTLTKNIGLFVRKFSDRYLYGKYLNGVQDGGRVFYVKIFSVIGICVMLIACINFMNLTTAQASQRIKDVGIMKTLGSGRKILIVQFVGEALILTFISLVVGLVVVWLALPQFNEIVGKQISLLQVGTREILIIMLLTLIAGLLSGSYPAFYLTRLTPTVAMRGLINSSRKDLLVRRGLVITQFTVSIIFIIGFLVTNKQIQYALTKDLGYKPENVIRFQWTGSFDNTYNTFITELRNVVGVVSCTNIDGSIINNISTNGNFHWGSRTEGRNSYPSPTVGFDFVHTMGMEIIEGREFSKEFGLNLEGTRILVNEEALKAMGLKDPIGKKVGYADGEKEIIGVVKNFHYGSLHDQLQPLFFRFFQNGRNVLVRIESSAQLDVIAKIKTLYKKFNPEYPFDFTFLDDEYQALYTSEKRVADLSKYFTLFAVIISSLGLFGLAQFTVQRRFKEINVRKVYGASKWNIMLMLFKDYMTSVIMAISISVPLGYWILNSWLANFYYRMELEWWYFLFASFLTLGISLLTIVGQTFRAAQVNPITGLREK
jgi:putative ABC transport system permease protein